jgi:hypothetical protein
MNGSIREPMEPSGWQAALSFDRAAGADYSVYDPLERIKPQARGG